MARATKLKITSLKFISAVDAGAQGPIANVALVKRAATGDEYVLTAKVAKLDEAIGVVFGYAVASTVDGGASPHVDFQGDAVVGGDELIKVALGFAEAGSPSDVMHDCVKDGWVPFVMPLNADTKKAFKLSGDVEGIAIGMKPSAETFKRFVSGELAAFSIYGSGERTPLEKKVMLTTSAVGHTHMVDDLDGAGSGYTSCELMGRADTATYHSHPWARDEVGAIVIGMSAGHSHDVLAPANAEEATTETAIAARAPQGNRPTQGAAAKVNDMKLVILTEAQHTHYSKLAGDAATAFVEKTTVERDAIVKAAQDADPVVFSGEKTGAVVRKSDGALALTLAKQAETSAVTIAAQADELAKARVATADAEIEKSAREVMPHVGIVESKRLMKMAHALPDKAERDAAIVTLKALDAARAHLGAPSGRGGDEGDEVVELPSDALRKHVEKFQATHKLASYEQAFVKALNEDAETKRLYTATRN